MTPETKTQALKKLARFNTKIGYPDQWKNYSKLVVKKDELVQNLWRSAPFEHGNEGSDDRASVGTDPNLVWTGPNCSGSVAAIGTAFLRRR